MTRQAAVPPGIALSAPAILSRHDYVETLLTKETLKAKIEPRASSAGRRTKTYRKSPSLKKLQFKTEDARAVQPKYSVNLSSDSTINLPEFKQFQSDHLLVTPQLHTHPTHERPRSASSYSNPKLTRPALSNASAASTQAKRLSRSRHSYDTTVYYEKQQKYSKRATMAMKFDSMSCFKEVSHRRRRFLFVLLIRANAILFA